MACKLKDWDRFVLSHTKPGNIALHFISALCFFLGPILSLVTMDYRWLIIFLISGFFGIAGHYFFKDGSKYTNEAKFFLRVPLFVLRMFWQLAHGTYGQSIARARRIVSEA